MTPRSALSSARACLASSLEYFPCRCGKDTGYLVATTDKGFQQAFGKAVLANNDDAHPASSDCVRGLENFTPSPPATSLSRDLPWTGPLCPAAGTESLRCHGRLRCVFPTYRRTDG